MSDLSVESNYNKHGVVHTVDFLKDENVPEM